MIKLPSCSDYIAAIENSQSIKVSNLVGGRPEVTNRGTLVRYTGGFCIVFPYFANGEKYALRFWHASVNDARKRTQIISNELQRFNLPYFIGFKYVEDGISTNQGIQPMVVMDWADGCQLKDYIEQHLKEPETLETLASSFLEMTKALHNKNISHGDLQHGNILVRQNGSLQLVDYDSMFVPALEGYEEDIKGLRGYQHEARWRNKYLTPKADYFSELVIYTSIKALAIIPSLWKDLKIKDTDWMLFSEEDIKSPNNAVIFNILEAYDALRPLSLKLKDFIACDSIEDLEPLSKAIPKPLDEAISKKWESGNGFVPPVSFPIDATHISNMWRNHKKEKADHSSEVTKIANKW